MTGASSAFSSSSSSVLDARLEVRRGRAQRIEALPVVANLEDDGDIGNFEIDPDRLRFGILDDVGDDFFGDESELERELLCHSYASEPGLDCVERRRDRVGPTGKLERAPQVSPRWACIEAS